MLRPHALRLAALALVLAHASAARAETTTWPAHRLALSAGVPVPLRAYGGDASLDAAGLELLLALHTRASYAASPLRAAPALRLGARASLSVVGVSDGELSLWGFAGLLGAHAGAQLALPHGFELALGAGPALARSGFRIDAELHRSFWAPALFGFTQLALALYPSWHLLLDASLEHVWAAPADQAFFNQRLGSTTLLAFSLGVQLAL